MARSFRFWATACTIGILGLLILTRSNLASYPLGLVHTLTSPLELLLDRATTGIRDTVTSFLRVGTLARRLRDLGRAQEQRDVAAARAAGLEEENARLREALGMRARVSYPHLFADVTGVTTDGETVALRVNRGTGDALRVGNPVISVDGTLVGIVRTADWSSASVDLLTSGSLQVTVRASSTAAEGIVRGQGGLGVLLENVPRTSELRVGDQLVTTGLDGHFPPQLLVGTIAAVRAPENVVFQEADVRLQTDLHRLRIVAVLL